MTRIGIANEIDRVDGEISELQMEKREIFAAYREKLEKDGVAKSAIKLELEAFKTAIRQRRDLAKDETVATERNALVDEILDEIRPGTPIATRAPAPRASEADGLDIPESLRR